MLKCPICGMIINDNNWGFNKWAFSEKNSSDRILYCPFCGIEIKYFNNNDMNVKEHAAIEDKSLLSIIDHAMKLEVYNSDFYKAASDMAYSKEVKEMFKALYNIELMHARIHQKLGRFSSLPELAHIDYSRIKEDYALIKTADQREEHAVSYYNKYMATIKDEKIKHIFQALSYVEKGHTELLENAVK